jgi:hypothetical protein
LHCYQMRCTHCPTRVWVSALMLEAVPANRVEPVCLECARSRIARSETTPIMAMTQTQVRYFAENGLLDLAYEGVSALNASRASLLRHLDDMVWMTRR